MLWVYHIFFWLIRSVTTLMFTAVGSDKEHCLSKFIPFLVASSKQFEGSPASAVYLFVGRALY